MTKYVFCIDDGVHTDQVEEFTDLEEAKKCYEQAEKEAMKDPEKYFGQSKEDWTEDCYPNIELNEWDGEEFICTIDDWNPDWEEEEEG